MIIELGKVSEETKGAPLDVFTEIVAGQQLTNRKQS
jgi:hypothetical protein